MKKEKCRLCGKYEIREKEVGEKKCHGRYEIKIPVFHFWKWCTLKNNWCRHISGNCDAIIKPQNKIVGNNRGLLQEEEK